MQPSRHALDQARRLVRGILGIEPYEASLLTLAARVIRADRTDRCVAVIEAAEPARRTYALASLAGVVAGSLRIGDDWWSREHRRSDGVGHEAHGPSPDVLLSGGVVPPLWYAENVLSLLQRWAADDVADMTWGAPCAFVDLNCCDEDDRFELAAGAKDGDRVVLTFDPGSRVDALIVTRSDGVLGSKLDLSSCRHSTPAEAWWGMAMSLCV